MTSENVSPAKWRHDMISGHPMSPLVKKQKTIIAPFNPMPYSHSQHNFPPVDTSFHTFSAQITPSDVIISSPPPEPAVSMQSANISIDPAL